MARREAQGPYMIYNGPIPEAVKARMAEAAAQRGEAASAADPEDEGSSAPAVIFLMLGTLTVGLALGLWLRPTLDQALGHAPPPARAALAVTLSQPAPPPIDTSAIEAPAADNAPDKSSAAAALQIATADPARPSAKPSRAANAPTSAPARAADKAGTKTSAKADAAPTCAPGGSKADQMVCADPTLVAADRQVRQAAERAANAGGQADQVDWLVTREAAARRSPEALKDAYQRHITELVGLSEPPH